MNGLTNRLSGNENVEKAKELHDQLEVNLVAYNKHRLNMQDCKNVNGFNQLFKGGEAAVQSWLRAMSMKFLDGCKREGQASWPLDQ